MTTNQRINTRLEKQAKKGKIPHHTFVLKIYRPIAPNLAQYIFESWRKFYVQDILFVKAEYSISFDENIVVPRGN